MKRLLLTLAILGAASLFAADGAALYKKCAGCHGAKGEKVALGKSLVISEMSKEDFVKSLKGYKDGSYGGPMKGIMKGQVSSLDDAAIEAMADHITSK